MPKGYTCAARVPVTLSSSQPRLAANYKVAASCPKGEESQRRALGEGQGASGDSAIRVQRILLNAL